MSSEIGPHKFLFGYGIPNYNLRWMKWNLVQAVRISFVIRSFTDDVTDDLNTMILLEINVQHATL